MKMPFDTPEFQQRINRRAFLGHAGLGLGGLALASLMQPELARAASSVAAVPQQGRWAGLYNPPPLPIKAKRIIHLCMAGGPSHLESFDNKPELKRINGQPFPDSFTKGQQLAQLQNARLIARGPFVGFAKYGKSGQEISSLDGHRADQPRPRPGVYEQRVDPQGLPEHGIVAAVRPGRRDG
jgi:hypothetical protein